MTEPLSAFPGPKVDCHHESVGNLDHEETRRGLMPAYTVHPFPSSAPFQIVLLFFFFF